MANEALKGLADLNKALSAFPANLQKSAYGRALRAAAAPIRDRAREITPHVTGLTAASIQTGSVRKQQNGNWSITIRANPKKKHSYLAFFHEFGVDPHLMPPSNDKLLATVRRARSNGGRADVLDDIEKRASAKVFKIGERFVTGPIKHPGHKAANGGAGILRPALDQMQDEALGAFAQAIRDWMEGKTGYAPPVDEAA